MNWSKRRVCNLESVITSRGVCGNSDDKDSISCREKLYEKTQQDCMNDDDQHE